MIAAGAAFPTAVRGDQRRSLVGGDPKIVSQSIPCPRRQVLNSSGIQPSHGTVHSWMAAPRRFSKR